MYYSFVGKLFDGGSSSSSSSSNDSSSSSSNNGISSSNSSNKIVVPCLIICAVHFLLILVSKEQGPKFHYSGIQNADHKTTIIETVLTSSPCSNNNVKKKLIIKISEREKGYIC